MSFKCQQCDAVLGREQDLCFFEKGNGGVHLIPHPHCQERLLESGGVTKKEGKNNFLPFWIHCSQCDRKLGPMSKDGPDSSLLLCFDVEKGITLSSYPLKVKNAKALMDSCQHLMTFKWNTFPIERSQQESVEAPAILMKAKSVAVQLPRCERDLIPPALNNTIPTRYQMELFIESMQENSIIVLPTGAGKTLVGILAIKRMVELNPTKIALFLVPTIPLVYQQSEYIYNETGLHVLELCSQSWTSQNAQQRESITKDVLECKFNVIVTTGGFLLDNWLFYQRFSLGHASIIVFDEAHHAKNDHPYARIIKDYVETCLNRPMLLGLTASPSSGGGMNASYCCDLMRRFRGVFRYPYHERDSFVTFIKDQPLLRCISCAETSNQVRLKEKCSFIFTSILTKKIPCYSHTYEDFCQIGYLRFLKKFYQQQLNGLEDILTCVHSTLQLIEIAGTQMSKEVMLDQMRVYGDAELLMKTQELLEDVPNEKSPKVEALMQELRTFIENHFDSIRDERILIFVTTRIAGRALLQLLRAEKDLNDFLFPNILFGHNGSDGMTWEDDQQRILSDFRTGHHLLLISTSVIEEGLDVSKCSAVFLFDNHRLSLRSFIQLRGRARSVNSQFILISNSHAPPCYLEDEGAMNRIVERLRKSSELSLIRDSIDKFQPKPILNRCAISLEIIQSHSCEVLSPIEKGLKLTLKTSLPSGKQLYILEGMYDTTVELFYRICCDIKIGVLPILWTNNTMSAKSLNFVRLCQGAFVEPNKFRWREQENGLYAISAEKTSFILNMGQDVQIYWKDITHWIKVDITNLEEIRLYLCMTRRPLSSKIINSSVLELKFCKEDLESVLAFCSFISSSALKVQFIKVERIDDVYSEPQELHGLGFEKRYFVESLLTLCPLNSDMRVTTDFLRQLPPEIHPKLCQSMIARMRRDIEISPTQALREVVSETIDSYEQLLFVRRVLVTPKQVLCYPPELLRFNAITEMYGSDYLLIVNFRDEDQESKFTNDPRNESVLQKYFEEGLDICGSRFHFLAGTPSQLRKGNAWFWNVEQSRKTVEEVLCSLGDFSTIKTISKLVAYQGLLLTPHIATVKIDSVHEMGDITKDCYNFTDGAGLMSSSLCTELASACHLGSKPSAFQIRFAGHKGMITKADINVDYKYRPSMKKFESSSMQIRVVGYSRHRVAHMNQQLIGLLSTLGIPDTTFLRLLNEQLLDFEEMFYQPDAAARAISSFCPDSISTRNINLCDPFVQKILIAIFNIQVSDLRSKARILVKRSLMSKGVPDHLGLLEPNQLFFSSSTDQHPLVTHAFVCKSPHLHPGDIRKVELVDVPGLHEVKDVIVFSTKGDRPISNMCSGSDYDGDEYSVFYDEDLLCFSEYPPMEYEVGTQVGHSKSKAEHLVQGLSNETLGTIANLHTAIMDFSSQRALDADCIELARLFSSAVDSIKTGEKIILSQRIKNRVVEKGFPHFMKNKEDNGYHSESILGQLFDRCKYIESFRVPIVRSHNSLNVEGYQSYMKEAEEYFVLYKHRMESLLQVYESTTEEDLWISSFQSSNPAILGYNELLSAFRDYFYGGVNNEVERQRKAVAWYNTVYQSHNSQYFGFAWIGNHIWTKFLPESQPIQISALLEQKLKRYFVEEREKQIGGLFQKKEQVDRLLSACEPYIIHGSFAVLLQDLYESDIDLALVHQKGTPLDTLRHQKSIFDSRNIPSSIVIATVPIIKVRCNHVSIDICASASGIYKTYLLRAYIKQKPIIYALLLLLTTWARNMGLVGCDAQVLPTSELIWLFISYCLKHNVLKEVENCEETGIEEYCTFIHQVNIDELSCDVEVQCFLNFLRYYSCHGEDETTVIGNRVHTFKTFEFESNMLSAYYSLVLSKDIQLMLIMKNDSTPVSRSILLGKRETALICGSEETFSNFFRTETGAQVDIRREGARFSLDVEATPKQFTEVHKLVRDLCYFNSQNPSQSFHRFIEGSPLLIFCGATSSVQKVCLKPFVGNYSHHTHALQPKYRCVLDSVEYLSIHYSSFYYAIKRQLSLVAHRRSEAYKWKAVIRFGGYYLIHVDTSLLNRYIPLYTFLDLVSRSKKTIPASSFDSVVRPTEKQNNPFDSERGGFRRSAITKTNTTTFSCTKQHHKKIRDSFGTFINSEGDVERLILLGKGKKVKERATFSLPFCFVSRSHYKDLEIVVKIDANTLKPIKANCASDRWFSASLVGPENELDARFYLLSKRIVPVDGTSEYEDLNNLLKVSPLISQYGDTIHLNQQGKGIPLPIIRHETATKYSLQLDGIDCILVHSIVKTYEGHQNGFRNPKEHMEVDLFCPKMFNPSRDKEREIHNFWRLGNLVRLVLSDSKGTESRSEF